MPNDRDRGRGPDAEGGEEESRGRRFAPVRRACPFCADKSLKIDYKDPDGLRRFITDRGKIRARRKTGACALHQRAVAAAIKRARTIALIPYVSDPLRSN